MYNPYQQQVCGIYAISGLYLGGYNGEHAYIGQSVNLGARWNQHLYQLEKGTHPNSYLQNAWNFYGGDQFTFIRLEVCERVELDEKEIHYIKDINTLAPNGYNLKPGGSGGSPTAETRAKMSRAKKGRKRKPFTESTRFKMSASHKKPFKLYNPDGELVEGKDLSAFCKENGLNNGNMCQVLNGKRSAYKGWTKA